MIGIIITGHGHFATGIQSTIKLLSGDQDKLIAIDFEEGMTADQLQERFKTAVSDLGEITGLAFFTDIPGGTPFNQAVMYKTAHDGVTVLSGTNVSMIMEVLFQRELNVDQFEQAAITAGQSGVVAFKQTKRQTPDDDEDGI